MPMQMQRVLSGQVEKAKGSDALITSDTIQNEVQECYTAISEFASDGALRSIQFELWDPKSWQEIPMASSPKKKRPRQSGVKHYKSSSSSHIEGAH